ncbi:MAG: sigma-70 family RNA polymerase sigma factor [Bacteroidota bacterium]
MASARQQEFLDLIQSNSGIIHKVIRLYVDGTEDQRDLYQEIVAQAWGSFSRFAGNSKFSTWLYRVALNTALTFQKKAQKRKGNRSATENDLPTVPPASDFETRELLLWAIRHLVEADRMIILLHLEGYDNGEISDISGINKNHVGVKLHRIKKKLTALLQPYRYGSERTVE